MSVNSAKKGLPWARHRPAAALCLVGVWFSSGCNLGQLIDRDGNLRETTTYRAAYQDTLLDVARRFHLGYVEMVAANPGTDPWLPGEGAELVLPTVHLLPDAEPEGIIINLADMRLYYVSEPGAPPQSYPIGIGREGLTTPLGTTEVVRKKVDPTWRPTPRMRGRRSRSCPSRSAGRARQPARQPGHVPRLAAYLIHGTNKPWGIGRRSSSGCIRMYPEDIEALFDKIAVGTKVTVVDQPVKLGWIDGELFMEAHPTQAQSDQLEALGRFDPLLPSSVVDQVLAAAGEAAPRLDWSRIRQAAVERRGYPLQVTR